MSSDLREEVVINITNSNTYHEAKTVPHFFCGGVCCVALLLVVLLIISLVDDNLMHLGISYNLLIIGTLISIMVSIIWNYTCSYEFDCLSCGIGCEKIEPWAPFFLLEATFLVLLCVFGISSRVNNNAINKEYDDYFSNYDEISYPIGVLITFGVLSVISLMIGILGVYNCRENPKHACFFVFFNLVTFSLLILDMISDVITAVKIYSYKDGKFFWTSISFTS